MPKIKLTCGNCQHNANGLHEVKDLHGNSFALIGECCLEEIRKQMKKLSSKYGAYHIDGVQVASPRGSPHLTSIEQLKRELA